MSIAALAVPFVLALLPIIWLVVALIALHLPAWKAAIGSFVIACGLALTWWGMPAIDHLYFKREGLVAPQGKAQPHGHGWSLLNNVAFWTLK